MGKQPIYLIEFFYPERYMRAATFLRFQEHYESPKFRGKIFSWEEFMDWNAKKEGEFTYLGDWDGFNIPSQTLRLFYEGRFDPLTTKERKLLDLLKGIDGSFYVISLPAKDVEAFRHEFVHGLFCVNKKYRREVKRCVKSFDPKRLKKALTRQGYHRSVFTDEVNAYALTGLRSLTGVRNQDVKRLKVALKKIFFANFGFYIERKSRQFLLEMVHVINFPTAP